MHFAHTLRSGSIGSFFGRGVLKKVSNGSVTGADLAPVQPEFVENSALSVYVCVCGKGFDHPPAFVVHQGFCAEAKSRFDAGPRAAFRTARERPEIELDAEQQP